MTTAQTQQITTAMRERRSRFVGAILVALSACCFATLGIFGKLLMARGLDLQSTLAWRFGGAALILLFWMLLRARWRIPLAQFAIAFAMGAIGYALQATLYFVAMDHIGVGLTSLLLYTYPAFVALLAWLVDHERPTRRRLVALGIAFIGTSLAADPRGPHPDMVGLVVGLATGAWYAVYLTVGTRLVREVDSLAASGYVCLGAAASFLTVAIGGHGLDLPRSGVSLALVAGIVVVATVIPIIALFAGMRRLGTPRAALLSTLEPVVTVALGAMILGERFGASELGGGALIVAALILLQVGVSPASGGPDPSFAGRQEDARGPRMRS
ncbi:EamA/RhaT family transporter [bacterium]|nr:MAG: EamA/RhaT family transporter [bacterium]